MQTEKAVDFEAFLKEIGAPLETLLDKFGATVSFQIAEEPPGELYNLVADFCLRRGWCFRITGPVAAIGERGVHMLLFWRVAPPEPGIIALT